MTLSSDPHAARAPKIRTLADREGRRRYMRKKHNMKYRILRTQLLDFLGGKCFCCGETTPEFLTLDHIHGGGRYHRRSRPKTYEVYADVLKTPNARDSYRLLCWNCNCSTRGGRICPHNKYDVETFLNICKEFVQTPNTRD